MVTWEEHLQQDPPTRLQMNNNYSVMAKPFWGLRLFFWENDFFTLQEHLGSIIEIAGENIEITCNVLKTWGKEQWMQKS